MSLEINIKKVVKFQCKNCLDTYGFKDIELYDIEELKQNYSHGHFTCPVCFGSLFEVLLEDK